MATGTTASDFNMKKLTMREFEDNIRATIEYGGNFLAVSRRGTGKSEVSRRAIHDSGLREVFMNLSMFDRGDLQLPRVFNADPKDHYIRYQMTTLFEPIFEGDQRCVLLFDEVDKADTAMLAPLLEITHDRSINGRPLKNLQACLFTANLQAEGGSRPSLPLLDRCEKYLIETSHTQWLDWASKEGKIHPSITAFVNDNPDELFGDVDPGDIYADPSPRGWHKASNVINFGEAKKWSNRVMSDKVAGFVGKKCGIKYHAYFTHYQELLPMVERVMRGEKLDKFSNLEPSKQCIISFTACTRLARILDETKPGSKVKPKEITHVGNFLRTLDPEMSLISVRANISLERVIKHQLDDHETFDSLLKEISKRING